MLLGDCRTSSSIKKSRAYMAATWRCASIDYLICLEEESWGNRETEGLRCLAIDDQYELRRLLDREIGGSRAPQDLVDIDRTASVEIDIIWAVAHQAASFHGLPLQKHRRQPMPHGQLGQVSSFGEDERRREHEKRRRVRAGHG